MTCVLAIRGGLLLLLLLLNNALVSQKRVELLLHDGSVIDHLVSCWYLFPTLSLLVHLLHLLVFGSRLHR
jgi:hypothetical protein